MTLFAPVVDDPGGAVAGPGGTGWCRRAHQWLERELGRADFEAMARSGGEVYDSLPAAIQAAGYDGALAGTYFA
ncbi:hypothetical protein QF035_002397 [Streptomyces umbrinus]|uniref:Uncharacterized protein n=1 Tax=Streptomyces umbrinus TaxID=67370 RepID=A0ABU0SMM4_9ACTN|nr:hypothetical protein [Streptomyces umbrinus]MDQ1024815.1 hypothetical protein [Streptomyces umbrinus]